MDVFIARQPIFDRYQKVFAYELLFRLGNDNFYNFSDGDAASLEVINNSFNLIGINSLTGGKRAFINFTQNLIKSDIATILPNELVVIEILEDVELDNEIIESCKNLKKLGYVIALDDFVYKPEFNELIKLADIIKIDFINTKGKERESIVTQLKRPDLEFLAEKVETQEEFEEALKIGYSYFQGYFFSKPVIVSSKDIPSYKWSYINVLKELNQNEPDFKKIEDIIQRDVALSYKLLRFINSSSFGFKTKIRSIKHALSLLGKTETMKWLSLITLVGIKDDKSEEILRFSILRAKFGELIACELGLKSQSTDIFFMGMFSMIDVLVNIPLEEVLNQLHASSDIKIALLGGEGGKNCFRDIHNLTLCYEMGQWDNFIKYADKLKLNHEKVLDLFFESLNWSDEFLKA